MYFEIKFQVQSAQNKEFVLPVCHDTLIIFYQVRMIKKNNEVIDMNKPSEFWGRLQHLVSDSENSYIQIYIFRILTVFV